ncbi:hypothetical protein [Novosphingobium sp. Fuku2-ISO-50]|uniref:hypothetical protein n=1 Tax=Novosphingobium sp. Fuku2-ISO-50 TaxID=1739114 RepID=UPI0012E3C977
MTTKHADEFKRETVRIALISGLSQERVAADMGIGKSTLGNKIWRQNGDNDLQGDLCLQPRQRPLGRQCFYFIGEKWCRLGDSNT